MTDKKANSARDTHAFMLHAGELLHRYGAPSYRLEAAMQSVSRSIGIKATFLYTPTALIASFGEHGDETTYLRRVDAGDVDINKLLAFDRVLEELNAGQLSVEQAHDKLQKVAAAKPPYSTLTEFIAWASVCGSGAVLFGGGIVDILIAFVLGLGLFALAYIAAKRKWENDGWLAPLSGFLVALCSLGFAHFLPIDHRIATLAVLIIPIPGLSLTIALTELAVGHLSAGSARLAGASVKLLTLVFGVAIAWQLAISLIVIRPAVLPVPSWSIWLAVVIAPVAFGVLFRAPAFLWPAIVATSVMGFIANRIGEGAVGPEFGAFCGAFAVGACSNLYARWFNRPAMALLTPGILILLPGSIGYRSVTAMLESNTIEGIELAFAMVMIGISLAGGIVMANVVLSPKRSL